MKRLDPKKLLSFLSHPFAMPVFTLASIAFLIAYRIYLVEKRFGVTTDCQGCFIEPVLIHETRYAAIVVLFLALGALQRLDRVQGLFRLGVLGLLGISLADVCAEKLLAHRLIF